MSACVIKIFQIPVTYSATAAAQLIEQTVPGTTSDDLAPTQTTSPSIGAKKISREHVACLIFQNCKKKLN